MFAKNLCLAGDDMTAIEVAGSENQIETPGIIDRDAVASKVDEHTNCARTESCKSGADGLPAIDGQRYPVRVFFRAGFIAHVC